MVRKLRSDDEDLNLRHRVLVALGAVDKEARKFNVQEPRIPGGKGGGRWTKGGGAGGALKDALDGGNGGGDVASTLDTLLSGKNASVDPKNLDKLMEELKGRDATNLAHLDVKGKGNENLFTHHVRDIPRSQMPQLPSTVDGVKPFMELLAKKGVKARIVQKDPRDLVMTQSELDSKKVGKMVGFMKAGGWQEGGVLLASTDGSILDGHHRWAGAAAVSASGTLVPPPPPHPIKVTVLEIDLPIDPLLDIAQTVSGARVGLGTENG